MRTMDAIILITMIFYTTTTLLDWFYFRPNYQSEMDLRIERLKKLIEELEDTEEDA